MEVQRQLVELLSDLAIDGEIIEALSAVMPKLSIAQLKVRLQCNSKKPNSRLISRASLKHRLSSGYLSLCGAHCGNLGGKRMHIERYCVICYVLHAVARHLQLV